MRPEIRFLFLAARQQVTEEHFASMLEISGQPRLSWNSIFSIAEKNGIAPLIYSNVLRNPALASQVPGTILDHFRLYSLRQAYLKARREKLLREGIAYLRQRSIEVLLLKGAVLDWLVYDQPWYTVSKDTDIVLNKKKEDFPPVQIREMIDHFYQSGIEFDFFEHHDVTMNGVLPVNFHRIWQDAQVVEYRGQEVRIPTPEDLLISLCINSCRKRFVNLKSLCDIAETIRRCSPFDWEKFAQRAIDFGCNNIVYAALLVTRKTLGCGCPDKALSDLAVPAVRSQLIRWATAFGVRNIFIIPTSPTPERKLYGRRLDPALFLTYSTYTFTQIRRKFLEIQKSKRVHTAK